jgi:hypothetical protein
MAKVVFPDPRTTIPSNYWNNPDNGVIYDYDGSYPSGHWAARRAYSGGDLYVDGSGSFTGNLEVDGAATFAGSIQAIVSSDTYGFELTNGTVGLGGFFRDSSGGNLLIKNDSGTVKSFIYGDGTASFSGGNLTVDVNGSVISGGSSYFGGSIEAVGTGTFGSNVDVGGSLDDKTVSAVRLGEPGYVQARRSGTDGVWFGYPYNTGIPTSQINADGSSEFKGRMVLSGGTTTTEALKISGNNNSAKGILVTNAGGATTSTVDLDGAAQFNTSVISEVYEADARISTRTSTGFSCRGTDGSATVTINKLNGSAVFTGTVTANGNILTRASGDLDVGDRLEKADAALQSLKTAAAASTDFDTLKAAIATALANI